MNHITKREKEILAALKKEPMITQDELAARMKISRSAAAVHISNLMRKGYILGRGYIFDERSGVLVIGQTWLEIRANCQKVAERIEVGYGGWGYRLATELREFQIDSSLLTILGRDETGDQIYGKLNQMGVNLQHVVRSSTYPTAKRVYIVPEQESGLIEDMEIQRLLNQKLFQAKDELLRTTRVLLVDGYLPVADLRYLAERIKQYNLHCTICGRTLQWLLDNGLLNIPTLFLVIDVEELKAAGLTGTDCEPESLMPVCRKLVGLGFSSLIVVIREQGVVLATSDEVHYLPSSPLQPIRPIPGLTAGIAGGLASGFEMRLAVRRAMGNHRTGKTAACET